MFSFLGSVTGSGSSAAAAVAKSDDEVSSMEEGESQSQRSNNEMDSEDDEVQTQQPATTVHATTSVEQQTRITGQVKMFNDVKMWGFITRLDTKQDVFVHINDLDPKICPSPTLFTGEYVSFELGDNGTDKDGKPRFKAVKVRGVNDGSLLCDHGEIVFKNYSRVQF